MAEFRVIHSAIFLQFGGKVHLLAQPDFLSNDTTWIVGDDPRRRQVCFESGNHRLVSLLIDGQYPDQHRPIPPELPHEVVIASTHHLHLVEWLHSLRGRGRSVDLGWAYAGHMSLIYHDTAGNSASMAVPVRITGTPPRINFGPQHLAARSCVCSMQGSHRRAPLPAARSACSCRSRPAAAGQSGDAAGFRGVRWLCELPASRPSAHPRWRGRPLL